MRRLWVVTLVFGLLAEWAAAAPITVPIYIEDNHAGSFYWLADHLDLDEEFTLIHFDAHTDASGIFDSDKLRERLRRVGSLEERQNLLEQWRRAGVIQCFNWIEPLIPAPISQVLWVHRGRRGGEEREARDQLDGHLEAAPRTAGSFRERYRAVEFDQLRAQLKGSRPVVVTIDLDYFADVPANRRAREFERVWKFVVECRNLRAVTIAISRPYLKSDEQADDLVRLAIEASLSLPTASIQFEPFAMVGKDRSLRAREFLKRKEEVPAFKLANASGKFRALLLANRERITVRTQPDAWKEQLATWENGKAVRLAVRNHEPSTDTIWRVPIADEIEVELQTEGTIRQIEWFAVVPEYRRCNLTADSSEKSAFAIGAPPRPRWREVRLPGADRVVSITREPGVVRVKARVLIDGHPRETAPIEIRRINGTGFRAALMEQFGLPYLFGSGQLRAGGETGPETGFGADCANFVIYALRRQGYAVPWSNPKQLKKYLEPVAPNVRPGESILNESDIADGLIVHLGSHVAVVMEDRPPLGILDANDRVAHQLEGVPEILSLGRLLASRKTDRFDLWRVPKSGERIDLVMGGDVMLGRTIGSAIERGFDPLLGLRPLLEPAAARIVNLECVLSDKGAATAGKRYCFRAPFDALRVLTSARIDAVSLANNHAADFGRDGLLDAIARLESGGVITIGAGETAALAPYFFTAHNGRKGAVIALNDVDDADSPLVATTRDRERIAAALAEARTGASFVLVFMHWGDENVVGVTERQRDLARWLIDHGADAIAGSHPHCLQPFDSYHGRPIFYSLGNLVFDGAPTLPNWNRGQLLAFDLSGARPLFRLVPVQLDARGFPQLVEAEDKERRFTNRRLKDNGGL